MNWIVVIIAIGVVFSAFGCVLLLHMWADFVFYNISDGNWGFILSMLPLIILIALFVGIMA